MMGLSKLSRQSIRLRQAQLFAGCRLCAFMLLGLNLVFFGLRLQVRHVFSGALFDHAKTKFSYAAYSLPQTDSWEFDEVVTEGLVKEELQKPENVSRFVGLGSWTPLDSLTDRNLLINERDEVWVPSDCAGDEWCKNGVKRMERNLACSEMQSLGLSRVLVLGDSLARHFFQALTIVFSGDYEAGSLRADTPRRAKGKCSGDKQFSKKSCWRYNSADVTTCNGTLQMKLVEAFHVGRVEQALSAARAYGSSQSDLIVAGIGLHTNLRNHSNAVDGYLMKIVRNLRKDSAKCMFVWFSVHAVNSKQQPRYRRRQNLRTIYEFNRGVEGVCEKEGLDYINSFLLTMGQHSYDGVHYAEKINIVRASLFLWQFFRSNGTKALTR